MTDTAKVRPLAGGRIPPHDLDAEQALLGAMLLGWTAGEGVTADDFYKPAHGHIFGAIMEGMAAAEAVDPVTVAGRLKARGLLEACGGGAELLSLQARAPARSSGPTYARIIAEHARRRRVIGAAAELSTAAYEEDDEGIAAAVITLAELPSAGRVRLEVQDLTLEVDPMEPTILRVGP